MKGKLPVTGFIKLESNEAQWLMLTKKLINDLSFTALIEKESNSMVRVKLRIVDIYSPDMMMYKCTNSLYSNLSNAVSIGMSRMAEFVDNHLTKNSWLFMGYIDGEERKPILIIFYQSINLAVYSLKLETDEKFFPVQLN